MFILSNYILTCNDGLLLAIFTRRAGLFAIKRSSSRAQNKQRLFFALLKFEAANEPKKLIEVDNMNHDYKKHENLIRIVNSKVIEFFNNNLKEKCRFGLSHSIYAHGRRLAAEGEVEGS